MRRIVADQAAVSSDQNCEVAVIVNEVIAQRIIALAEKGERDPDRLCAASVSLISERRQRSGVWLAIVMQRPACLIVCLAEYVERLGVKCGYTKQIYDAHWSRLIHMTRFPPSIACFGQRREYKIFVAGRAPIGENVCVGFNGMRLASDQTDRTTAALTKLRCRPVRFFEFDVFHDANAMLHASGVNSVSLQPTFVRTQAFGRAASLAWVKAPQLFGLLEPYELSAIYVLLVTLAQREYITQVVVFALGALGASHG